MLVLFGGVGFRRGNSEFWDIRWICYFLVRIFEVRNRFLFFVGISIEDIVLVFLGEIGSCVLSVA